MTVWHFIAQSLPLSPFPLPLYYLNNVEREVKHKIIIKYIIYITVQIENNVMMYETSIHPNQPVYLCSLIRVYAVCPCHAEWIKMPCPLLILLQSDYLIVDTYSNTEWPASVAQLDALSDWRPRGRGFTPRRGWQHSFVEIDHEIFSTIVLSLSLIQEGQLSVSGERMCTILVNHLED